MSNIHGLSFSNPSDAKQRDQEEFFGGGATSGTAVWRPTNGPQRQGGGAGGAGGAAAPGAAGPAGAAASPDMRQIIQQITVYSNGFVLGDGEFRDAKDARNAAFIAALKAGEVPAELEAMCRKEWGEQAEQVRVNLVDKSSTAYTPPKAKFSFAQSKGQQLTAAAPSSASTSSAAALSRLPPSRYVPHSSSPTTVLQVVTADRRKLRETLNEDTTVAELYQHVLHALQAAQQPSAAHAPPAFELVAGFPPKPLVDGAVTLKQAGICGASVQQRALPQ